MNPFVRNPPPPLARHGPPTPTRRTHPPLPDKHPQNGWQHLSAALGLILSSANDSFFPTFHRHGGHAQPPSHRHQTLRHERVSPHSRLRRLLRPPPPPYGFAPSSLYATLLADYTGPASIAVTTRDASLPVLASAIPDSDDVQPSTRHQTLAGVLSREAAPPLPDTSTCVNTAILRTRRRRLPPPPSSRKPQG